MSPRYLTKSRFKTATECPTKLFYTQKPKEYANLNNDNTFLESLAEGGYQIGSLAKLLYPNGIEVEGYVHDKVESETLEHLKKEKVVLFEAAIRFEDFFIRIDVLVKNGNDFEIHEVKAKSFDPKDPGIWRRIGNGLTKDLLPYLQDVAFQKWVLQKAIPNANIRSYLLMTDKTKNAEIDGMNQMFRISVDKKIIENIPDAIDKTKLARSILVDYAVDDAVEYILTHDIETPGRRFTFEEATHTWAKHYKEDKKIPPILNSDCRDCEFNAKDTTVLKSGFRECWKEVTKFTDSELDEGTVLDIFKFRKKDKLIQQGVYKLHDVGRDFIGDFEDEPGVEGISTQQRQWYQISSIPENYDLGGFCFDRSLVAHEMSSWKYPLHFIDFETSAVALPFYVGLHPYEQVAFQFSHHVMEKDGSIRHADEFLCVEPGEFPNYKLVTALKDALDKDNGSIFMWSSYENTILTAIGDQLKKDKKKPNNAEDLITFIHLVTRGGDREMIDLCKISEKSFYHKDTKGSSSIKKVLPALFKISKFLQDTYSKPIYGANQGIPSKNFSGNNGYAWYNKDEAFHDPYILLKDIAKEIAGSTSNAVIIAEGGSAATAYARLQFEDMDAKERLQYKGSLLRYCELDTLAMAMVVEAWKEFIEKD